MGLGSDMRNPQELVSRMKDFCGFLAELSGVQAEVLLAPMAEGKWSVQETIAHIMAYDESFLQTAVLPIEDGRQPRIPEEADNQSFNEKAAGLGRKLTKAELLERATQARKRLVDHLQRLPAEAFRTKPERRTDADMAELLDRDFVSHDRSHVERMKSYLKSCGYRDR